MQLETFFSARLFDLLGAAESIEIDRYGIEQVNDCGEDAGGNPVLRCEGDDESEWQFSDQDVKVRHHDGSCVAMTAPGDWDAGGDPSEVTLTFTMSRPIELQDVTGHLYSELAVAAIQIAEDDDLDEMDDQVAGVYSVLVRRRIPDADKATAALDAFHSSVGVSSLDDFVFYVFNPVTGLVLEEAEGSESYTKGHLARDVEWKSDELPVFFSVRVEAIGDDGSLSDLGQVVTAAGSEEEASRKAHAELWDSRLDAASCSPRYETKRLH